MSKTTPAPADAPTKIVLISQVQHDDKVLEAGESIELPKEQADALIEAGAALKG